MKKEVVQPIRTHKIFKPQEEWKGIIAIYLYLAGMGAGSFIIGTLIHWSGVALNPLPNSTIRLFNDSLNLSELPLFWGPILVAMGAPFLILDLGIKWRFMYACLNPKTSWVSRGFIILSTFILLGLAFLAKSILPFNWLHAESFFWSIVEAIAFVFAIGTALYTGILLKATKSVPLWNTKLLPILFLMSALSTGSMAILLSTLGTGLLSYESRTLELLKGTEQILVLIEGVILFLFLLRNYKTMEQAKHSVRLLLSGEKKWIFWGGIVLLGFIFPILLENISSYYPENLILIYASGIALLCGGFFLRLGVLSAGIKDQIPMKRLIEVQYGIGLMERTGLRGERFYHSEKNKKIYP